MNSNIKQYLSYYKDCDLKKHGLTIDMVENAISSIGFQSNDLFRYTFAHNDQKSKVILSWLISALLDLEVIDVHLKNCEPAKGSFLERGNRLDVMSRIIDEKGEQHDINIEIQNYGTTLENTERSQGYVAKQVVDLLQEGKKRSVAETVHVMLCNKLALFKEEKEYYHEYTYMDKKKHTVLPGCLSRMIYLEMEKLEELTKKPIEQWERREQMGFVIRYSQEEEMHDIIEILKKKEKVFQMMQEKKDEFFRNTAEALGAIKKHYDELEDKRQLEYATETGYKQGVEDGMKKGVKEGLKEGIQQGILQGELNSKRNIIKNLYEKNCTIEFISECVGLSVEEIQKIIGTIND